jgi:hypothetical protein
LPWAILLLFVLLIASALFQVKILVRTEKEIILYGIKQKCNLMPAKVRAENNAQKPLEKPDPAEGEIKSNTDRIAGLHKDIEIDSVDLQHAARDILVRTVASD